MMHPDIPTMGLSIMNPWAWLIVNGHKEIENRDWKRSYRGPVAIHAGKKFDQSALTSVLYGHHPVTGEATLSGLQPVESYIAMTTGHLNGGIIGVAEIIDCVDHSDSEWFVGRYGFVMANARPVPFIPCPGALGFFDWRKQLAKAEAKRSAA